MSANLVQIAFFHLHYQGKSVEAITREADERARDGSSIKTIIRINDVDGHLTEAVRRLSKQTAVSETVFAQVEASRWRVVRMIRIFKAERANAEVSRLEAETKRLAVEKLEQAFLLSRDVAVERYNEFRLVREDEMHELLESARAATCAWFFVFAPNNLFSQSNELLFATA